MSRARERARDERESNSGGRSGRSRDRERDRENARNDDIDEDDNLRGNDDDNSSSGNDTSSSGDEIDDEDYAWGEEKQPTSLDSMEGSKNDHSGRWNNMGMDVHHSTAAALDKLTGGDYSAWREEQIKAHPEKYGPQQTAPEEAQFQSAPIGQLINECIQESAVLDQGYGNLASQMSSKLGSVEGFSVSAVEKHNRVECTLVEDSTGQKVTVSMGKNGEAHVIDGGIDSIGFGKNSNGENMPNQGWSAILGQDGKKIGKLKDGVALVDSNGKVTMGINMNTGQAVGPSALGAVGGFVGGVFKVAGFISSLLTGDVVNGVKALDDMQANGIISKPDYDYVKEIADLYKAGKISKTDMETHLGKYEDYLESHGGKGTKESFVSTQAGKEQVAAIETELNKDAVLPGMTAKGPGWDKDTWEKGFDSAMDAANSYTPNAQGYAAQGYNVDTSYQKSVMNEQIELGKAQYAIAQGKLEQFEETYGNPIANYDSWFRRLNPYQAQALGQAEIRENFVKVREDTMKDMIRRGVYADGILDSVRMSLDVTELEALAAKRTEEMDKYTKISQQDAAIRQQESMNKHAQEMGYMDQVNKSVDQLGNARSTLAQLVNSAEITSAQNKTQASMTTSNNMTQASVANARLGFDKSRLLAELEANRANTRVGNDFKVQELGLDKYKADLYAATQKDTINQQHKNDKQGFFTGLKYNIGYNLLKVGGHKLLNS